MKIDLHIHSDLTDGSLSLEQIAILSKKYGLDIISVAEHDTLDHIQPMQELASKYKIKCIPAIEITAYHEDKEVHILGYNVYKNLEYFSKVIEEKNEEAKSKLAILIEKLATFGIHIKQEDIFAVAKNRAITRKFVARVIARKGYCSTASQAFTWYLAKGTLAHIHIETFTPEEAIKFIEDAGGITVISHPALIRSEETLFHLISLGVRGIEVFHKYTDAKGWHRYLEIAKRHNLLVTGGSDFHGEPLDPECAFGAVTLPLNFYEEFEEQMNALSKKD
jgi:hypothetical protein